MTSIVRHSPPTNRTSAQLLLHSNYSCNSISRPTSYKPVYSKKYTGHACEPSKSAQKQGHLPFGWRKKAWYDDHAKHKTSLPLPFFQSPSTFNSSLLPASSTPFPYHFCSLNSAPLASSYLLSLQLLILHLHLFLIFFLLLHLRIYSSCIPYSTAFTTFHFAFQGKTQSSCDWKVFSFGTFGSSLSSLTDQQHRSAGHILRDFR